MTWSSENDVYLTWCRQLITHSSLSTLLQMALVQFWVLWALLWATIWCRTMGVPILMQAKLGDDVGFFSSYNTCREADVTSSNYFNWSIIVGVTNCGERNVRSTVWKATANQVNSTPRPYSSKVWLIYGTKPLRKAIKWKGESIKQPIRAQQCRSNLHLDFVIERSFISI